MSDDPMVNSSASEVSSAVARLMAGMSPETASMVGRHILQRLGEGGQPPEFGVRLINVGNESYLKVLEEEYFEDLLKYGSSFKLVQGYFGGGKTHFLTCVRELAWDYGFATAVVELSPTESPYDDSLRVYQAVARRVASRPARPFEGIVGLPMVLRDLIDARLSEVRDEGHGEVEARLEVDRWLQSVVGRAPCESHSYRQAVVGFCRCHLERDWQLGARLEAWLLGEGVPQGEVRPAGVYESMERSNGFTMLRCLTQMMVAVGMKGTALLFDEVDRTLSVSARRSQAIGDNLRQVIDLCGRHQLPHTLFMYAVPPEFMRNVVPDYPALYQRLKSPVPLSARSPQAVLIDLEKLDLPPEELLYKLGERLIDLFSMARKAQLDREVQAHNAREIAKACVGAYFEVNHRRLFAKTWVDFLFHQKADGEVALGPGAAVDVVLTGYDALINAPAVDDFADF